MSIFSTILQKIFPSNHPAVTTSATQTSTPAASASTSGTAAPAGTTASATQPAGAQAAPPVDVEAILTEKASKSGQTLNWRESIVDLMKLLGLDSSLEQRKQLAKELGYSGSTSDSAAMNIWLHKQVMAKLAQNGGKVPAELTH
jgi:hypothetical protein